MFEIKIKSDVFGEDNNTHSLAPLDAQRERRVIRDAVVKQVNRLNAVNETFRKDFEDLEEIVANSVTEKDVYDLVAQEIAELVENSNTADADIMVTINGLRKSITALRKEAVKASANASQVNNGLEALEGRVELLESQVESILYKINRSSWAKRVLNSIGCFFKRIGNWIAKTFSKVF